MGGALGGAIEWVVKEVGQLVVVQEGLGYVRAKLQILRQINS